jgi:hypothetical protein
MISKAKDRERARRSGGENPKRAWKKLQSCRSRKKEFRNAIEKSLESTRKVLIDMSLNRDTFGEPLRIIIST